MSDPSPYVVSYSFGGYQANNPTSPLPATPLDNELAGIATAVAELISAITDIRREDGALNNGIVTFESFEAGLQLLIDPTNGQLVAAAVATAQAAATSAGGSAVSAAASAAAALAQAINAANSAATVNLSLYLAKANNLAGLGSLVTSRSNLGLGSVATFDVGAGANNIVQLDASAKLLAHDGSQLINMDRVPIGATIYINGGSAPAGYLKENGALLSRASYPLLWAYANSGVGMLTSEASFAAGYTGAFTDGDLATTFRIPDARGEFIRAYDDGRGVDSGRDIRLHQDDSLKSHTHNYQAYEGGSLNAGGGLGGAATAATTGGPSTGAGAETRPRNNAKLACIKAYTA